MTLKGAPERVALTLGNLRAEFLPSGDLYSLSRENLLLNGLRANPRDGAAGGIWLKKDEQYAPLTGIRSRGAVRAGERRLVTEGEALGVRYRVTFCLTGDGWLWDVSLRGEGTARVLLGQDTGLADLGAVLTNELYAAQYVDHRILDTKWGKAVRSHQNMGDSHPVLLQGVVGAVAETACTDGLQFFGLQYKETDVPQALTAPLRGGVYQGEFSYIGLETGPLELAGKPRFQFYGVLGEAAPDDMRSLPKDALCGLPPVRLSAEYGPALTARDLTEDELQALYPERELEERDGEGRLLSCFLADGTHVVARRKELRCERPHGGIIQTMPSFGKVTNRLLSTTHYMYGVLGSHTVVGNTTMHKLDSVARGLLNVLKNGGCRLCARAGGQYRLLTLPSVYETAPGGARWLYRLPEGDVDVNLSVSVDEPVSTLSVKGPRDMEYWLCDQLAAGEHEFTGDIRAEAGSDGQTLRVELGTAFYPGAHYLLTLSPGARFTDDGVFFADGKAQNESLLTIAARGDFSVTFAGSLDADGTDAHAPLDAREARRDAADRLDQLTMGLSLETGGEEGRVLTQTLRWHAMSALTHFSMPHGLEQSGGAAWGTRDVCQGPFELFMTYGRFELCRDILLRVFARQEESEWPQWFMFDAYPYAAGDCHGDVVFWPLRCLSRYILVTGDRGIQDEVVPYAFDRPPEPVSRHVQRAVEAVRGRLIGDTGLITYAGGDWDDTLQPARPELRDRLVSTWTVALCYQVLTDLAKVGYDTYDITDRIRRDFGPLLVKDDRISGFAERTDDGGLKMLLHPDDHESGITCRLLPMTRAILAGLSRPEWTRASLKAIDERLMCPDGVRLMDAPARYDGGVSHRFLRAEQAANVGREISLQYVHAHIRYAEAMARLGLGGRAWDALLRVAPPLIGHRVPNAMLRQGNLYFSSSEGDFPDRYAYSREFGRLRDGSVPVKGGWRLYSSGPGIWTATLVGDLLGIRVGREETVVAPVLPAACDGMKIRVRLYGATRTLTCRAADGAVPLRIPKDSTELNYTVCFTPDKE